MDNLQTLITRNTSGQQVVALALRGTDCFTGSVEKLFISVSAVDGLLTREEQIILGVLLSFFLAMFLILIICCSVKYVGSRRSFIGWFIEECHSLLDLRILVFPLH